MLKVCALAATPAFLPIVVPHYSGMEVSIPLFRSQLADPTVTIDALKHLYAAYYTKGLVHFAAASDESGFLSSAALSGKDILEVSVYGNEERILLVSRFDNLGKGASGAAIQNMNLVLGVDEATGLCV